MHHLPVADDDRERGPDIRIIQRGKEEQGREEDHVDRAMLAHDQAFALCTRIPQLVGPCHESYEYHHTCEIRQSQVPEVA